MTANWLLKNAYGTHSLTKCVILHAGLSTVILRKGMEKSGKDGDNPS